MTTNRGGSTWLPPLSVPSASGRSPQRQLPAAAAPATGRAGVVGGRADGRVAVGAVDWLIRPRLERHHRVLATLRTHGGEHLAFSPCTAGTVAARRIAAVAALRLAGGPAVRAPARLVGEALLGVKRLLARREGELLATIATRKDFVLLVDLADSRE